MIYYPLQKEKRQKDIVQIDRKTERQNARTTEQQRDGKINHRYISDMIYFSLHQEKRQKDRKTERQKDRKTERQKDKKTKRQKDKTTE